MVDRRTIIKGAGGIAGLGLAGIGATAFTGSAVAANLTIQDPDTVTTDDGQIQFVNVALDHTAEWDGFDRPVDAVAYRDTITLRPNSDSVSHVVYDNTNAPVLLDNYSSDGSGSDGWGGPGEHVSDTGGEESQHYREHGKVHANIDWNIVVDPRYASAKSVEDPYEIDGSSVLEPETDGNSKTSTIEYQKDVFFYEADSNGGYTSDDGSTTLALMTGDGVEKRVRSVGQFALTVQNQANEQTGSGSGSSSAG